MNKSKIFLYLLAGISFLFSLLFWAQWAFYLQEASTELAIFMAVTGIIYFAFLGLFFFLNNQKILFFLFTILVSLPIMIFNNLNPYNLLAFLLNTVSLINLAFRININKNALIKPSLAHSLSSLAPTVTLTLLSLSLVLLSFNLTKEQVYKIEIPQEMFSKIYQTFIKNLAIPNSAQLKTIKDTALKNFEGHIPGIRSQLISQGIVDENKINDEVNRARENYLQQVDQQVNQTLTQPQNNGLDENSIKNSVQDQLNSVVDSNRTLVPYFIALSFFLTLSFFSSIFSALCLGLISFLLWLTIKFCLTKKTVDTLPVERVVLE